MRQLPDRAENNFAIMRCCARVVPLRIVNRKLLQERCASDRATASDDYDVLVDGAIVGRIMKVQAAPEGSPWMWTLAYGHHEDRWPIYCYEPTREAAIAAFTKS